MNSRLLNHLIAACNASEAAHKYAGELKAALLPFVGQKILKADGSFLKKISDVLPTLPNWGTGDRRTRVYINNARYHLWLYVETSVEQDHGNASGKVDGLFAKMEGDTLVSLEENFDHIPKWDLEILKEKVGHLAWIQQQAQLVGCQLPPMLHSMSYYGVEPVKP